MSSKTKNKVTLDCPPGCPCAIHTPPAATLDVVVEVRERGTSAETPLDVSLVEVTLTSLDRKKELRPNATSIGPFGQILATFTAVPQGWYRALAARRDETGVKSSAARNVEVVRIQGRSDPQRVILILSVQGVAKFIFLKDENDAPLVGAGVIVTHPDGAEQRHTTNGAGELRIPGATGDVFTVVRIEHATNDGIIATETEVGS